MSSNSSSNSATNYPLDVRFEAVLRHVWKLREDEVAKILHFRMRCTADTFLDSVDTEHTYKDYLTVSKNTGERAFKCEVEYLDCSMDSLQLAHRDLGRNALLVLSFRICPALQVVIVRPWDAAPGDNYEAIPQYNSPLA